MVNLEYRLTVDDLIVKYMIEKILGGFEPKYTFTEFESFLNYFTSKMEVEDTLNDMEELFNRFFERKNNNDWYYIVNGNNKLYYPHLIIENNNVVKPNYNFSTFDSSIINIYFMHKSKQEKIKTIIKDYLKDFPKRQILLSSNFTDEELFIGKYCTIEMIYNIWNGYVEELIKNNKWPIQCRDINKYLLENDLAIIINTHSISDKLFKFYEVISKRFSSLYKIDKDLEISNGNNRYLAYSNYKCLFENEDVSNIYLDLLSYSYGDYKNSLYYNLKEIFFRNKSYNYIHDNKHNNIEASKVKKLIYEFDKRIK